MENEKSQSIANNQKSSDQGTEMKNEQIFTVSNLPQNTPEKQNKSHFYNPKIADSDGSFLRIEDNTTNLIHSLECTRIDNNDKKGISSKRENQARIIADMIKSKKLSNSSDMSSQVINVAKNSLYDEKNNLINIEDRMAKISNLGEDVELRKKVEEKLTENYNDFDESHTIIKILNSFFDICVKKDLEISKDQKGILNRLASIEYSELSYILFKFKMVDNIEAIYEELQILLVSLKNIESLVKSAKSLTAKDFRRTKILCILKALVSPEVCLITNKQYLLFKELYIEQDLIFLSTWEVYCATNDLNDFIDNLFTIERFEYFSNKSAYLEKDQDEETSGVDKKLDILNNFIGKIPENLQSPLLRQIKNRDYRLSVYFKNFQSNKYGQEEFLNNLIKYGEEFKQTFAEIERKEKYQYIDKSDWRFDGGEPIEDFVFRQKMDGSIQGKLMLDAIEANEDLIQSIYLVYDQNGDKGDFWESLKIYGRKKLREHDPVLIDIEEVLLRGGLIPHDVTRALSVYAFKIHKAHTSMLAAKEMYDILGDDSEFVDTVEAFLKQNAH